MPCWSRKAREGETRVAGDGMAIVSREVEGAFPTWNEANSKTEWIIYVKVGKSYTFQNGIWIPTDSLPDLSLPSASDMLDKIEQAKATALRAELALDNLAEIIKIRRAS